MRCARPRAAAAAQSSAEQRWRVVAEGSGQGRRGGRVACERAWERRTSSSGRRRADGPGGARPPGAHRGGASTTGADSRRGDCPAAEMIVGIIRSRKRNDSSTGAGPASPCDG